MSKSYKKTFRNTCVRCGEDNYNCGCPCAECGSIKHCCCTRSDIMFPIGSPEGHTDECFFIDLVET